MKLLQKLKDYEWHSFILTLIATLIGVFAALMLTDASTVEKERKDSIKLLTSSKIIVTETLEYTQKLGVYVDSLERDSTNYNEDKILEIQEDNPLPYPELFESIIASELLLKNMSAFSHAKIYTNLTNLKKLAAYETIDHYKTMLTELALIIELEIQYQEGESSIDWLEGEFKKRKQK